MEKTVVLTVILATAIFALGCNKSAEKVKGPAQSKMDYNYTYDKREVFFDDASADLKELGQRINELSEKTALASTAVKTAAQPKIEDLRQQRVTLTKKLDALKVSKEANWNELKGDYQKADSRMKVSLRDYWKWVLDNTGS